MLEKVFDNPGTPYGVIWVVDAPGAHPLWHQYAFFLHDLTTDNGVPPKLYMEGATHELIVYALDPSIPVRSLEGTSPALLEPANHGYQFRAASNEEAHERVAGLVRRVEAGELNPDTDFASVWDRLFTDGVTLRRTRNQKETRH